MLLGSYRRISLKLGLLLLLTLVAGSSAPAQVVITPLTPPVVNQGSTYKFSANLPVTWSMAPGSRGSIDSDGTYHAPAEVTSQQSVGGCQLLPNDHIINTRIDSLPVSSNSDVWIGSANYGHLIYYETIPTNYSDASTPTTNLIFRSSSNNGPFTFPLYPNGLMQNGWWILPYSTTYWSQYNAVDHHMLTVNPTTCHVTEIYKYYPIGTDPGNPTTNSVAGVQYDSFDYALNTKGTTDAAGMSVLPMMIRFQEWQNAVNTGGTINHAARITFRAAGITNRSYLWPATLHDYTGFGLVPFGARVRLKSSYDISGFSPQAQVLLKQLQQYGAILDDTGSDWNVSIEFTKLPYEYSHAIYPEINGANISPSNFEFVDESSLEVSATSGLTRTAESVCATSQSRTTCRAVVLTGVTIGVPRDQLYIQAGAGPVQLTAFVNGSSNRGVTWTMHPSVGSLTKDGLYTPPSTVPINTDAVITAASNANSSVQAHINLVVLTNGVIRLIMAGPCGAGLTYTNPNTYVCTPATTPYVDSQGNSWQAQTGDAGGGELNCGLASSRWDNSADINLYKIGYSAGGDMRFDLIVPNGTYTITGKFANSCRYNIAPGSTAFSIESQGTIYHSNVDIVVAAGGPYRPVDFTVPSVVSNSRLSYVLRFIKGPVGTTISALEIAPAVGDTTPPARPSPP